MMNNYETEMLDQDMPADVIEQLQLSFSRIEEAFHAGELLHLTQLEIGDLLSNARLRDLQKTIVR